MFECGNEGGGGREWGGLGGAQPLSVRSGGGRAREPLSLSVNQCLSTTPTEATRAPSTNSDTVWFIIDNHGVGCLLLLLRCCTL